MAADDHGAKNAPIFFGQGTSADAEDLTLIASYAASVGNRMAGTNADRMALNGLNLWPGLEFYETDTDRTYVWRSSTLGWRSIVLGKKWSFERSSSDERNSTITGTYTNIAAFTISGAPAGAYLIGCNFVTAGSDPAQALMRLVAGSTNISNNFRADLSTQAMPHSFIHPFDWGGGDLGIALDMLAGNGTGYVYTAGTGLWAQYLGPTA